MLYTLVGNGNPNRKETISTIESLREATDDFWMILVDPLEDLSEASSDITQWILKNQIPFELVTSLEYTETDKELPAWTNEADYIHFVKNPLLFSVKVTKVRPSEGEQGAILVLADDIEEDQTFIPLVERANREDIPVYHLGGQMVQLVLEDSYEEPQEEEVPDEPVVLDLPESPVDEDIEFTKEDLEGLTRDELKSMVQSRGLVPKDMRSKESLIEVLMAFPNATPELWKEPTLAEEGSTLYYLLQIDTDGTATTTPLSAERAALALNGS